jgi:hypothetical protein
MAGAVLDFRLSRAGLAPGQQIFTPEARAMLLQASDGLARRLTMLAHLSMEEAADRASTLVREDHVNAALAARGISLPKVPAPASSNGNGTSFLERVFTRLRRA